MPDAPVFDPTDRAFIEEPYPRLAELREHAPVIHSDEYGLWLITRHEDVLACQRDRRLGRVLHGHAEPSDLRPIRTYTDLDWEPYYDVERYSLLLLEPPEHTRIRSLLARAFTPRRVRELRPAITDLAERVLDAVDPTGFDLLAQVAQPYSVGVIATLLGAPLDDADLLLAWSHAIVKMYELAPTEAQCSAAITACQEFGAWTEELVARRRRDPQNDLITALCQAETEDGTLSVSEIVSTVILLLNAGHEATVNTMGNGVTALLRSGQWQRVASGEVAAVVAIEEMLRWDSPLQLFERWVLDDGYEVAGQPIPKGDKLAMLFGAANRDPRAFDDPDRFEAARGNPGHITFGAGTHFCIGAPLARLELEVALGALASRFPSLHLLADPRRIPAFVIRGYERVDLAS